MRRDDVLLGEDLDKVPDPAGWEEDREERLRRELRAKRRQGNRERLVHRAMSSELTPRQRQCVELYYFGGMRQAQIARQLGIGKSSVCRHLQKGRVRLERVLRWAGADRD